MRRFAGRPPHHVALLSLVVVFVTACGAGTPAEPGTPGPGEPPETADLEGSLNALGVNTTSTDRLGPDGAPLPADYAPLGGVAAYGAASSFAGPGGFNAHQELFVVGPVVGAPGSAIALVELTGVEIDGGGGVVQGSVDTLHTLDPADNAWASDDSGQDAQSTNAQSLRAAAAGDLDGDGLDEIAIVYVDTSVTPRVVRVKTIDDGEGGHGESVSTIAGGDGVLDVNVVTGDFDGDGRANVVVALADATGVDVLFLQGTPGSFTIDASLTKRLTLHTAAEQVTTRLAAGNLDYDNADELVVVVNEYSESPGDPSGTARYWVFDDRATSFAELHAGFVAGQVAGGAVHGAVVADVAIGDIKGSGIDQIVLGGLTSFNLGCEDQPEAIVIALDDATGDFEPLGATVVSATFSNCSQHSPWRMRFFHVTTPDLDGDGIKEIQAGRHVFASFSGIAPFTPLHEIPQNVFFSSGGDFNAHLTTNTSAVVAADVTGDGRENIVLYHQWNDDIRVWGTSAVGTVGDDGFAQLSRYPADEFHVNENVRPMLVPANVDHDSAVLRYGAGSHQLVFTEPIVIATIAAAPCADGIGQNVSACSTTFGNAESVTESEETTVSVTSGVYVGVKMALNVPWVGEVGTDFTYHVTGTATSSAGESYTVQTSRTFTSGPLEDAVIFSTIPYDRYVYDVLSHPDPDLIGGTVEVLVPRSPITLKVEREFYNARISEASTPVGANVFDHVPGDLATYPSVSRRNELRSQFGGLLNGPVGVGEGTGSTGLGIDVLTEVSTGMSLAMEYVDTIDITAGPALVGFTVGGGDGENVTVTSGESTTFGVSVGDLSSATFDGNLYSFGMFTYVRPLGGQRVKVINFWLE